MQPAVTIAWTKCHISLFAMICATSSKEHCAAMGFEPADTIYMYIFPIINALYLCILVRYTGQEYEEAYQKFSKIYENDNARKNHLFNTNISRELCDILLYDNTSCKNLIWGTDNYKQYGAQCSRESEIKNGLRNDAPYSLIKPRFLKNKEEQQIRSKEKAEVFTPSWICNAQNNLIDNDWFESENVFNAEVENGWITNTKKIKFSKKKEKSWRDYILQKRLEITCGEAPYLTSRYDSVLGVYIEPEDRIGLLDRKLRVINEQVVTEDDWIEWALIAVKNVYGYDFQGDNVFIARQNILATIMDFYMCKFDKILLINRLIIK